jgi:hypothetical protein
MFSFAYIYLLIFSTYWITSQITCIDLTMITSSAYTTYNLVVLNMQIEE